jgi:hypothetical protein
MLRGLRCIAAPAGGIGNPARVAAAELILGGIRMHSPGPVFDGDDFGKRHVLSPLQPDGSFSGRSTPRARRYTHSPDATLFT